MHHYISVYDDLISREYCQKLIDKFEASPQCYSKERLDRGEWSRNFTQINFYQNSIFHDDVGYLGRIFQKATEHYKKDNRVEPGMWPEDFRYEEIRMKRYRPGGKERFDLHVDVTDRESARRFLVVFFYLNDDFKGGETVFPHLGMAAKPKPGRLIMFPPMWAWWHQANPIISGSPKYIVGTLLHYV
jgi:prolyl 4-hydroxylase